MFCFVRLGALLKAAFFCAEILPLKHHGKSLKNYLADKYGGGFVLNTWSNLPHGSGLGTSSILAGTVLSALWTVAGYQHSTDSVLHAVSTDYFYLHYLPILFDKL